MNRTMIPKPESRDEWLIARRPYLNASATSVLFNRHPHLTPGEYATTKLTGKEQEQTSAMVRGQMLEDGIAAWYAQEHDVEVTEVRDLFVCERVMATLDRFVFQRPHRRLIDVASTDPTPLEIKSTNRFTGPTPEPHWLDQCQSQLLCTDAPEMVLAWMDASLRLFSTTVVADPELQAAIVEKAAWFMGFIDMGMVPEGVALSYSDAGQVYPVGDEAKVEVDRVVLEAVMRLSKARRERIRAEHDEDDAKAVIAQHLGHAELGVWEGQPIVEWKNIKPVARFNTRRFKDEHPELWAEFVDEHPQRRLRVLVGDDPGEDEL